MTNLLQKIKANIDNRMVCQAGQVEVNTFSHNLKEDVLNPARIVLGNLINSGNYCKADFNNSEHYFLNYNDTPKVIRLNGFDVVSTRDDAFELYDIEADLRPVQATCYR